jgi:hypothetical protein
MFGSKSRCNVPECAIFQMVLSIALPGRQHCVTSWYVAMAMVAMYTLQDKYVFTQSALCGCVIM